MNDKNAYIAAGIAGILLFAWGWWKTRHGKWFHWGDPFALLLLIGWIIVCFGFVRWEFGYIGQVTDACGHPVAYAFVLPSPMPKKLTLPETFDGPVPAGVLRSDADGQFQVLGKFGWNDPFKQAPIAWPEPANWQVRCPLFASTEVLARKRGPLSVQLKVQRYGRVAAQKPYYPREKAGLSEAEKEALKAAAARLYRRQKLDEGKEAKLDEAYCEFMQHWSGLLNEVGPRAVQGVVDSLGKHRPKARELTASSNEAD